MLFGPHFDFELFQGAGAAQNRRDAQTDVVDAVLPVLQCRDRQYAPAVQGDRVDDVRNSNADGKAGAALEAEHLGTAVPGLGEDGSLEAGIDARATAHIGSEAMLAPDQIGTMLSAVLAQDQRLYLRRRHGEPAGDQAAEARRVQLRAQAQ